MGLTFNGFMEIFTWYFGTIRGSKWEPKQFIVKDTHIGGSSFLLELISVMRTDVRFEV